MITNGCKRGVREKAYMNSSYGFLKVVETPILARFEKGLEGEKMPET